MYKSSSDLSTYTETHAYNFVFVLFQFLVKIQWGTETVNLRCVHAAQRVRLPVNFVGSWGIFKFPLAFVAKEIMRYVQEAVQVGQWFSVILRAGLIMLFLTKWLTVSVLDPTCQPISLVHLQRPGLENSEDHLSKASQAEIAVAYRFCQEITLTFVQWQVSKVKTEMDNRVVLGDIHTHKVSHHRLHRLVKIRYPISHILWCCTFFNSFLTRISSCGFLLLKKIGLSL